MHTTFFDHLVCRLGLASRGNTNLPAEDVHYAIASGVNFLNWCGHPDGLSQAVGELGARRSDVVVCVQFDARDAEAAAEELDWILAELRTGYVDLLTFYYVEHESEWQQIIASGGALDYCLAAKKEGRVRHLGLTSHQRRLAAKWAKSGHLDALMIRYNAAHRGAEEDVFPVTDALGIPVMVYTCLRWGALMRSTRDDPKDFDVPAAPAWYRFALQSPSVAVALMAPNDRAELEENLTILRSPELSDAEYEMLARHGQRVRKHAGSFP